LVYNKHLMEGIFVSVLSDLNPTGQRKLACNCSSNFKGLMSSVVPKKSISSLWEQRVRIILSCGLMD